jgi:hypothetical protein
MHPVGKSNNFSGGSFFPSFQSELFPHFFRIHFYNTMGRYGIVFIQNHLLLIFIGRDDFQIVRSKLFSINFLDTVYKFDWSCVSIFGKERDSSFPCFNSFKDPADRFVHEQSILNFILRFLRGFLIQAFHNVSVIWFSMNISFEFSLARFLFTFCLGLIVIETANF